LKFLINIGQQLTAQDAIIISLTQLKGKTQFSVKRQNDDEGESIRGNHDTLMVELAQLFDHQGKQIYSGFEVDVERIGYLDQTQFTIGYRSDH
jgi:hypothetical protein